MRSSNCFPVKPLAHMIGEKQSLDEKLFNAFYCCVIFMSLEMLHVIAWNYVRF